MPRLRNPSCNSPSVSLCEKFLSELAENKDVVTGREDEAGEGAGGRVPGDDEETDARVSPAQAVDGVVKVVLVIDAIEHEEDENGRTTKGRGSVRNLPLRNNLSRLTQVVQSICNSA